MRRLLFAASRGGLSVPAPAYAVSGPYEASYVPTATLKTQLHCHTSASFDGSIAPATMVANYVGAGYDALALTDHDLVTSQPAGADWPIVANELTMAASHIISLNSSYTRGSETDPQTLITGVLAAGGQAHLAHPFYSAGFSEAQMLALTGHFGFEGYNGVVISGPSPVTQKGYAVDRWDALLAAGLQEGVWAVAVDDLHSVSAYVTYDMGCVKVFVESASVTNIIAALVAGNFVADVANFGVTPGYPVRTAGDVSLTCTGATRIEAWTSDGLYTAADDDHLTVAFPFAEADDYLRLVAIGDYTEPYSAALSDRWGVVDGSWAASGGTLNLTGPAAASRIILRRHRQGDFQAQTDVFLSGSSDCTAALLYNVLDGNHFYMARIGESVLSTYTNKLTLTKTSDGSFGDPLAATAFTASLDTWYTIKMDYVAATGTTRAKVWERGTTEPDWMITAVDATWSWGAFGYRMNRDCKADNLYINGFQTFYQPLFLDVT